MKKRVFYKILFIISMFFIYLNSYSHTDKIEFTQKEKEFMKNNPSVTLGIDKSWNPYIYVTKSGEIEGFYVDMLKHFSENVYIEFLLDVGIWSEILEKGLNKEIDGFAISTPLEERKKDFLFSDVFIKAYYMVLQRGDDNSKITKLSDLNHKKLAVTKDLGFLYELLKNYPMIELLEVDSEAQGIEKMLNREVDFSLTTTAFYHTLRDIYFNSMKIGYLIQEKPVNVVISIIKEKPELVSIINKLLRNISKEEYNNLYFKWFHIDIQNKIYNKKDIVKVNVFRDNYPYSFTNEYGKPDGFFVDILNQISEIVGIKFTYKENDLENMLVNLNNENVDLIPSMDNIDFINEQFLYSSNLTVVEDVFFVNKKTNEIKNIMELKNKKIMTISKDKTYKFLETLDFIKKDQLSKVKTPKEAIENISLNKNDVFIMPETIGNYIIKKYKIKNVKSTRSEIKEYSKVLRFALKKDNEELLELLNLGIKALKQTGTYDEIYKKWLGKYDKKIIYNRNLKYGSVIITVTIIVLLLLVILNIFLNKKVKTRTKELELEIIERKKVEMELEQTLKEKSIFYAFVTHEIKTPINAINGYLELIRLKIEKTFNEKFVREKLKLIENCSRIMKDIVENFLDYSITEIKDLESIKNSICIKETLYSIIKLYKNIADEKRISIDLEICKEFPERIYIDDDKLVRVISNLLHNAIKFSLENSKIELFIINENNNLIIRIKDYGIGISEEKHKKIFDLYEQEKNNLENYTKGYGLGLNIVKKFVKIMNGDVFLESKLGIGTMFTLKIPFEIKENMICENNKNETMSYSFKSFYGKKALIVEDDKINRDFLQEVLKVIDLNSVSVDNVDDAIQMIEKEHFDIVFIDMILGDRTGIEVLQHINLKEISIKSFILTATFNNRIIKKCRELNCDSFISKPYTIEKLFKNICNHLDGEIVNKKININYGKFVDRFFSTFEEDIKKIEYYFEKGFFLELKDFVHRKKSGAGIIKEFEIYDLFNEIEKLIEKDIKKEKINKNINKLKEIYINRSDNYENSNCRR